MSKIVYDKNGKPTLFIHRDELIVPPSESALDVESDNQKKLEPCTIQGQMFIGVCEECKRKIVVHCKECQQKVSGCGCSMGEKIVALREDLHRRLLD